MISKAVIQRKIALLFLIMFVGICVWITQKKSPPLAKHNSPSPTSVIVITTQSISPIFAYHCLNETDLQNITQQKYVLIRETQLAEISEVECEYQTEAEVRNVTPSVHYTYQLVTNDQLWQQKLQEISAKSSNRKISNKDYMIADMNPVVEIAQVSFYGHTDTAYVAVTYTPVDGEVGDLLNIGMQITDKILGKN